MLPQRIRVLFRGSLHLTQRSYVLLDLSYNSSFWVYDDWCPWVSHTRDPITHTHTSPCQHPVIQNTHQLVAGRPRPGTQPSPVSYIIPNTYQHQQVSPPLYPHISTYRPGGGEGDSSDPQSVCKCICELLLRVLQL